MFTFSDGAHVVCQHLSTLMVLVHVEKKLEKTNSRVRILIRRNPSDYKMDIIFEAC